VRLIFLRRNAGQEQLHDIGVAAVGDLGLAVVLREGVEHRIELALLLRLEFPVGVHGQAERVFPRRPVLDLDPLERVVGENLVHRLIGGLPVEAARHMRVALLETEFLDGHAVLPDSVIAPMKEYGDKPLNIRSGTSYGNESDSLMALMCERWDDVRQAFGADLPSRFGDFGADEGHLWDCLAPHINASAAARRDFLAFCNETDSTLGLSSFIALAREQPSSDTLLNHCWRVFGREVTGRHERQTAWAVQRIRLEIAYILRDHFRDRADVKERLREALKDTHNNNCYDSANRRGLIV